MRALVDDDVDDGPASAETGRPTRIPSWITPAVVSVVVAVGVVLRFVQRSPLWLDEALSVNIASLPVGDMLDALRHDGHPPLYYLVLHYWIEVVGDGDMAVRALSGVFAVASLPLMWLAGRRLAGTAGGRWALVVAALSPYWVRYATETRMYSLVMLLVLGGYLLLVRALEEPRWPRLGGVAVVSGLLLLTHYWAFYLCAAVGAVLVLRAWRQPAVRGTTVRAILAVAAGGLLFLPWLGGFLYQTANTGTPWGAPFRPTAIVQTVLMDMGGGTVTEAYLYGSAVVVPLVLLAVAVGLVRLPRVAAAVMGAAYLGLALFGLGWVNYYQRTQSVEVGAAVAERAQPGDVVVYCPDQLGPAFSREMPEGLEELSYPRLNAPERVDWVDYAETNAAADPAALAEEIRTRADGHAIFLVWMSDYRTFGNQCEQLVAELGMTESLIVQDQGRFYEPAFLHWTPAGGT